MLQVAAVSDADIKVRLIELLGVLVRELDRKVCTM